jgi:hypothetical protein
MKIGEKLKRLFRRGPVTEEELAARKEAEAAHEQMLLESAQQRADEAQVDRFGGV